MKTKTYSAVMKRLAFPVAIALTMVLTPLTVVADDVITWRFQTHHPRASVSYADSVEFFKERIEERTDGRLRIEIYEAGGLVSTMEIFPAVQRGIVEMGSISAGYILDRSELSGIAFGLPNAFRDVWEAAYFWHNLDFESVYREDLLENYGVYWATSLFYPTEMVVKEPIESLSDFRGLNLRSIGTLQQFLTRTGAAASSIPGEELYQALATGVVDGAHWGAVTGAESMGLYELAKFHVRPPLNISSNGFIVNERAMDELPEDLREILVQTLAEQSWFTTARNEFREKVVLSEVMEEEGVEVIELPEDVVEAMTDAAASIWEQEAAKGDKAAEAIKRVEAYLEELGYL